MRKLKILLTHFAAHLQCTQDNTAKANIAKELQTYAATSSRITINLLQNIANIINLTTLFFYLLQLKFSKKAIANFNYKCRAP